MNDEAKRRLQICKNCEKFLPTFRRCGECGCFMDIKTLLSKAKCPHPKGDKWKVHV